jgi:hypothetical protein
MPGGMIMLALRILKVWLILPLENEIEVRRNEEW